MKRRNIGIIVLVLLAVTACNKNDEIIIENPFPSPENPDAVLSYKVVEYLPAPGQFINDKLNGSSDISSAKEACKYAESRLINSQFVSLGGWGGYLIVKFDLPIVNTGSYDFAIGCNSFDNSNEPGIVWVMQDHNGNGLPDDTWYELKGSYFGLEGYERNYWVTYYKPDVRSSTPWLDSNGETGEIKWLGSYHSQDYYYPDWINDDEYTLYGSRLPQLTYQDPETGNWTDLPFDWGYADNFGIDFIETGHRNQFRISDAVTESNQPANLSSINFIKVQTAVNGTSGWLGENSTEITGFYVVE